MTSELYKSFLQKNPSPRDRLRAGKSIRKHVSRSSLGNKRQSAIDILLAKAKHLSESAFKSLFSQPKDSFFKKII